MKKILLCHCIGSDFLPFFFSAFLNREGKFTEIWYRTVCNKFYKIVGAAGTVKNYLR
jgi:hypothetical protein